MHTLFCNVLLTRRQEMCFVMNEDQVLVWSGKRVHAAMTFLIDIGENTFHLDDGDDLPTIHVSVIGIDHPKTERLPKL